jgi:hypothetical protein
MPQIQLEDLSLGTTMLRGTSGAAHVIDVALETIVVPSGGYTYIAEAIPGALDTAAVWRCCQISSSGTTRWADGNSDFDNIPGAAGVGLSGLNYSTGGV